MIWAFLVTEQLAWKFHFMLGFTSDISYNNLYLQSAGEGELDYWSNWLSQTWITYLKKKKRHAEALSELIKYLASKVRHCLSKNFVHRQIAWTLGVVDTTLWNNFTSLSHKSHFNFKQLFLVSTNLQVTILLPWNTHLENIQEKFSFNGLLRILYRKYFNADNYPGFDSFLCV